mmetsp:Transcript_14437/g.39469  ORF Transcript_14437/g.39469 Transcript_14437/m.39469 type:complete len:231 (+) Transcript_14437:358-1050(+)
MRPLQRPGSCVKAFLQISWQVTERSAMCTRQTWPWRKATWSTSPCDSCCASVSITSTLPRREMRTRQSTLSCSNLIISSSASLDKKRQGTSSHTSTRRPCFAWASTSPSCLPWRRALQVLRGGSSGQDMGLKLDASSWNRRRSARHSPFQVLGRAAAACSRSQTAPRCVIILVADIAFLTGRSLLTRTSAPSVVTWLWQTGMEMPSLWELVVSPLAPRWKSSSLTRRSAT